MASIYVERLIKRVIELSQSSDWDTAVAEWEIADCEEDDIVDAKVREYFADTNLKRIRTLYGCTQAELAKRSNVSLRSIQMYEQRNKDINKASAETVLSLAKVLGCTMEDLLET